MNAARQAWIYLSESDQWKGRPTWQVVLERLKAAGCPGATAWRGLAGFGGRGMVHTATLVELSADLPVAITFIDRPDRVAQALSAVSEVVSGGLITFHDVHVAKAGTRAGFPPMPVSDVMTRRVIQVGPDSTAGQALELLAQHHLRILTVVDEGGRVQGLVTDGDLLERGGPELSPDLSVQQVMTPNPVSVAPDTPLAEAAAVMAERGLKRLPVVDGEKKLLGMVSRSDLLRTVAEEARTAAEPARLSAAGAPATVGGLELAQACTARPDTPYAQVVQDLLESLSRRVVVVDEEHKPVGLITDGDILTRSGQAVKPGLLKSWAARLRGSRAADTLQLSDVALFAGDLMSASVTTVSQSTPVSEAVRLMMAHRFKYLPVVDEDGRLLGLVGREHVLKGLHQGET